MKVLHIKCSAGFWGPDRQVLRLARVLQQVDISMEILVLYRRGPDMPQTHPLVARTTALGIPAIQFPDRGKVAVDALVRLRRYLSSERIAIIHTHDYKGNLLGALATAGLGVHHIASARGYTERTLALRLYKSIDLITLRFVPQIVTVSDHVRRQLITAGLPPDRIVTIYNAIDVASFASLVANGNLAPWRRELGLSASNFLVTIVGRLTPEKGHADFLQAASEIYRAIPESRFLVVGGGPLATDLQSQARSLGLGGIALFLGYLEDVANVMAVSDVIVISSRREGLPNVLLEALSLGKPVVATEVGGIPEVIEDRETGVLVPAGNPEALAQAVIELYNRPDIAEKIGLQGRQLVEQSFSTRAFARQMVDLYSQVLGKTSIFSAP